jgi:HlyD family secretion protein
VTTNNVVTYVVILSAPNPDKKLMPGMTASATIYVEEKENVLVLSGKAIRFTPDKDYLAKQFAKMKAGGPQGGMPAGGPPTGGMPSGQAMGTPPAGMMPGAPSADPGTKTVWIKDDTMGIHPKMIKIGIDNGSNVEVLSGLNEGDEVIISTGDPSAVKKTTDRGPGGFPF